MPLTCPICRAVNDAGPSCRRCRADLVLLFGLEAQRAANLVAATVALTQGRFERAARSATHAAEIRLDADVARLQALIALLSRDFHRAWKEHQRACSLADG